MKNSARKKKLDPQPTTLSATDKIKVLVVLPLFFVGLAVLFHFICVGQQTGQITKTVDGWKRTYHLSDEQAQKTIQIELDFHGNGSPFSMRARPAAEEMRRHHEEISEMMSPNDRARFMQAIGENGSDH